MSAGAVEIPDGGLDGLLRAVEAARAGDEVRLVEPALRAGGPLVTESFLTPFRFNLGPSLVHRAALPDVAVLEPEPLLAVGAATLGRAPLELRPADTVFDALDASGETDPGRRALLAGLALLVGLDPEATGSGEALARLAAGLGDLVLVDGGNGVAAAALVDELVAAGGQVVEGAAPSSAPSPPQGLGTCRLFVGLRERRPRRPAFAEAVGFDGEEALRTGLGRLRAGEVEQPLGFVLDNSHLDPRTSDEPLGSLVWQGVLPAGAPVTRASYTAAVLETIGVDEHDILFRLLWLPEDTGEALGTAPAGSLPPVAG